ncbi:MAG TPA: acetyl-CoA carboxylase biotin carboxyl carrier protein [Vicinamibacterales bacterium]|nr:acetyl-CoA carboxylase biotin carboxyl carrier protein [Vicinamibacterales bacterium]
MTLDEIKQILDLMREHELAEFEVQRDGETLRLRKHSPAQWSGPLPSVPAAAFHPPVAQAPAGAASQAAGDAAVLEAASEDVDLAIVKSPIVGTFYRAAEPGAPPFVDTGQTVRKGQVLCIIEAMKLMNEINAECDGEIVKVYVENGQAVQYGERLFAIRPN